MGEGLSREPQSLDVGLGERFDDPSPAAVALSGWRLFDVDAPAGYIAALAISAPKSRSCKASAAAAHGSFDPSRTGQVPSRVAGSGDCPGFG
jgi:hypothetical protein